MILCGQTTGKLPVRINILVDNASCTDKIAIFAVTK